MIETDPGAAATIRFFVEVESGDIARAEILPGLSFEMSGYRVVSGWRIPFRIVQTSPQRSVYTFRIEKTAGLEAIEDSLFAKP